MKTHQEKPDKTAAIDVTPEANGKDGVARPPLPKQFNFARHWKSKVAPLLADRAVVSALTVGLKLCDIGHNEGDPPWMCGRGQWNGQRARRGCLSWYQPWGRCHHIAPFVWALGYKLYPKLHWGFVTGDFHAVVVGWTENPEQPKWVMDILLFRQMSAQESLAFAKRQNWKFHQTLVQYLASFASDPTAAYAVLSKGFEKYEAALKTGGTVGKTPA